VTQQHLEILSEIAEMFSDKNFRSAMSEDADPKSLHDRLVSWQPAERNIA
jgi:PTS system nitrogen regulatory IIA component